MQTRLHSFFEATTNTLLGLLLALAVQKFYFHHEHIYTTFQQDVQLIVVMTVMSIGRSYVIRRLWVNEWYKDRDSKLIVICFFVWMIVLCLFAYKVM